MEDRFGRYRLLGQLAVGGTAELYLAEDTEAESHAPLVVKRLLPHLKAHAEAIELFLRDARLALRCAHPHVRRVYECGRIDAEYFIALEYVAGVDLRALLQHEAAHGRTPLPLGVTVRILLDLCAALGCVHARGVVHGDLSPANLLLSEHGDTKLCDFGVAVEDDSETEVRGTWAYMAPERIRGEPVDPRADVFSLGVLLWELCTGRRLFKRDLPAQTMLAVVEQPAPALPVARLEPIARRALAKPAAGRHPDCTTLADELEAAARDLDLDLDRGEIGHLVRGCLPKTGG